jgi:hypothetical protein
MAEAEKPCHAVKSPELRIKPIMPGGHMIRYETMPRESPWLSGNESLYALMSPRSRSTGE